MRGGSSWASSGDFLRAPSSGGNAHRPNAFGRQSDSLRSNDTVRVRAVSEGPRGRGSPQTAFPALVRRARPVPSGLRACGAASAVPQEPMTRGVQPPLLAVGGRYFGRGIRLLHLHLMESA